MIHIITYLSDCCPICSSNDRGETVQVILKDVQEENATQVTLSGNAFEVLNAIAMLPAVDDEQAMFGGGDVNLHDSTDWLN